jgi:hypothetical protein
MERNRWFLGEGGSTKWQAARCRETCEPYQALWVFHKKVEAECLIVATVGRLTTVEKKDYVVRFDKYLLRPEVCKLIDNPPHQCSFVSQTIESVYVLYRTTRDSIWREIGWDMFQSLERYTRYKVGYNSIKNVEQGIPTRLNEMPRFVSSDSLQSFKSHISMIVMHWLKRGNTSTYFALVSIVIHYRWINGCSIPKLTRCLSLNGH